MALFDFAGNIDIPDDDTKTAKDNDTDNNDDEKSASIPVVDEDKKNENIPNEKETKSTLEEKKEDNKNIINDSTNTILKEYSDLTSVRISGVVFFDEDLDSIYHKYSAGINNIVLKLYSENNELIAETISKNFMRNSGYFEFNNIHPGKYKITFSIPDDMFISPQRIQKYYGSKASRYNKAVTINIGNNDVTNAFIGLYK